MKLYLCAALALSVALPVFAVKDVASVAEGTVKKIDSSAKTVVIATKDGTERTFHFGERTSVRGVEAAGKGSEEALHGLKEGTEVAVRYTSRGTVDTAEEIDHIGKDGLKVTEGTFKKIDHGSETGRRRGWGPAEGVNAHDSTHERLLPFQTSGSPAEKRREPLGLRPINCSSYRCANSRRVSGDGLQANRHRIESKYQT